MPSPADESKLSPLNATISAKSASEEKVAATPTDNRVGVGGETVLSLTAVQNPIKEQSSPEKKEITDTGDLFTRVGCHSFLSISPF